MRVFFTAVLCFLILFQLGVSQECLDNPSDFSYGTGQGLIGGITHVAAGFRIQVADFTKTVNVAITSPDGSTVTTLGANNGLGSWGFSFQPDQPGTYTVEAEYGIIQVRGSPWFPVFVNSSTCPLKQNSYSGPFIEDCFEQVIVLVC